MLRAISSAGRQHISQAAATGPAIVLSLAGRQHAALMPQVPHFICLHSWGMRNISASSSCQASSDQMQKVLSALHESVKMGSREARPPVVGAPAVRTTAQVQSDPVSRLSSAPTLSAVLSALGSALASPPPSAAQASSRSSAKAKAKPQATPSEVADHAFILNAIALARAAAVMRKGYSVDKNIISAHAGWKRMMEELRTRLEVGSGPWDPRVLASIMHALAKLLPDTVDKQMFALAYARLTKSISSDGRPILQSPSVTPRTYVMAAYATALYGHTYARHAAWYRQVNDYLVSNKSVALDPSECAMLFTAYAKAGVSDPLVYQAVTSWFSAQLHAAGQAPLAATFAAAALADATLSQHNSGVSPTLWSSLCAEMCKRLQEWRLLKLHHSADGGARSVPFSPRSIATILHTLASRNIQAVDVYHYASAYFSTISASSGTDSGAAAGYRAHGTHPDDRAHGTHADARRTGGRADRGADGDVALLSTYDPASITSIMWSFTKAGFAGEHMPAVWASAIASMQQLLRAGIAGTSTLLEQNQSSSFAWSLTRASIPATDVLTTMLQYVEAKGVATFSVPALAQILWSSALQQAYQPHTQAAMFAHILEVADVGNSKPVAPYNPDAIAAFLLPPKPDASERVPQAANKLISQLYIAYMHCTHEGGMAWTLPEHVLQYWRGVYASNVSKSSSSKLHADVSRVLRPVFPALQTEYVTPGGLAVDIFIPIDGIPSSATKGWVVEVQGPSHFIPSRLLSSPPSASEWHGLLPKDLQLPPSDDTASIPTNDIHKNLVPSLATRAKHRLLAREGLKTVGVNWQEWTSSPLLSSEDRRYLLSTKGLPIPDKFM